MTRRIASLLFFAGVFLTQARGAFALDLAVLGNLNVGNQVYSSLTAGYTAGSATGLGFGAFLAHSLFPMVEGELGLMYVTRGGTLNDASGNLSTATYNYLMIPYLFRLAPVSMFSVGAGPYYAYGLGNVNVKSAIPGLSSSNSSYESQNLNRSDFGLMASVSFKMPVAPLVSLRADANYALGLGNIYQSGGSSSFRDLLFMAGVNVGF